MTSALTARSPHSVPAWVLAFAAALLLASLDIAAVLTAGAGKASLHNPIGLAVLPFVLGAENWLATPGKSDLLLMFPAYATARTALALLAAACAAAACATRCAQRRTWLLAAQLACVLALDSTALHLLFAVQLSMLLPLRTALAWLLAHYVLGACVDLLLVLDLAQRQALPPQWALLAYVWAERAVTVVGFAFGRLVLHERRTRQALANAHAQVLATQSLLADTVRGAERLRIARDLHDTIGHHLTALNLHLDLALRQAGGAVPPALPTACNISHELLAQVRSVVTVTRAERAIDLEQALRLLCAGVPTLRVELRIDAEAARQLPQTAHALFCCIQEAITNTLRHAQARQLRIVLETQDGATVVRVTDDGGARPYAAEGNGLRGMRERLEDLGGRLVWNQGGAGFSLEMHLPHARSGA